MIKLRQNQPYFSLNDITQYQLDDFSIITGINGSGKTNLLNAIEKGFIQIDNIDREAVIYYNYNEFNLVYDKFFENNNTKSEEEKFENKRVEFSKKLMIERNLILDQYKVWDNSLLISENFFYKELTLEILDWSDEEVELLNKYEDEKYFPLLNTQKNTLGGYFIQHKDIDIRQSLLNLKRALIKHHILISNKYRSKYADYEFLSNVEWDDSQIQKYILFKKEDPNFKFSESIVGNLFAMGFNPNFVNFVLSIDNNFNLRRIEKEIGIIGIKKYFLELVNDVKEYFTKNISKEYLDLAKSTNGENNIYKEINVDNGFLNLQEIASDEKSYQLLKLENNYNKFLFTEDKNIKFYNDIEFINKYGHSPLDLLNEVLSEYDCNGYQFIKNDIRIDIRNGTNNQNILIQLYNKKEGYQTELDALSSGEKTLIALSFYLYKLRKNRAITKLLLLDEIDSSLHPLMSKRLLDVLYNIFYKKMNIKIIMSSHSPSTIALAPSDCIFVMNKLSTPKISKVSKDIALKELTVGVPSFSINYENRRQVFVESENDVKFYEAIYNIYKSELNPEISLNFISSGDSRTDTHGIPISNCQQVIKITTLLRESGNKSIWGIIDWDLNKSEPKEKYVKVLGFQKRYSIENYLLDPLLLSILLWHQTILDSEKFEFVTERKYPEIITFDLFSFQKMIDKVVSSLALNCKEAMNNDLIEYKLLNKLILKIPKWYSEIQGHKLEELILKTYPGLQKIKKKEADLKNAIIDIVIKNFPSLISLDLLNIFKSIQED